MLHTEGNGGKRNRINCPGSEVSPHQAEWPPDQRSYHTLANLGIVYKASLMGALGLRWPEKLFPFF